MTVADTFARDHLPPQSEWPEFLFDRPEYRYPQQVNCVTELLDRQIDAGNGARPAITALIDGRPCHVPMRSCKRRSIASRTC